MDLGKMEGRANAKRRFPIAKGGGKGLRTRRRPSADGEGASPAGSGAKFYRYSILKLTGMAFLKRAETPQ